MTSSAAGIFGSAFLDIIGVWNNQPDWSGFVVGFVALALALLLAIVPAKRAASVLLSVEGITVALILVVSAVILIRILAHNTPNDATFTMKVFTVPSGTSTSTLFLGIVFGLLSFAGFEAASTLGEETHEPQRDIPRAILGTAIFGGIYFTVVTAIETMGFGIGDKGVAAFIASGSGKGALGELGSSYIGNWVGDLITLGAAVSAFGCCLACVVGGSRLLFAIVRDLAPGHALGRTGSSDTPAVAAMTVAVLVFLIGLACAVAFNAKPFDTFFWSGTIGTLILLVAYVLATIGCIKLIWIDKKMPHVPTWEIVIPLAGPGDDRVHDLPQRLPDLPRQPARGGSRSSPSAGCSWSRSWPSWCPGFAQRLSAGLRELDETQPEPWVADAWGAPSVDDAARARPRRPRRPPLPRHPHHRPGPAGVRGDDERGGAGLARSAPRCSTRRSAGRSAATARPCSTSSRWCRRRSTSPAARSWAAPRRAGG